MIRKQFRPQMLDLRPVPCLAPAVAIGFSGLSRAQTLFTAEFDQISSPDITVITGRFQPLRCVTVFGPAALATERGQRPYRLLDTADEDAKTSAAGRDYFHKDRATRAPRPEQLDEVGSPARRGPPGPRGRKQRRA